MVYYFEFGNHIFAIHSDFEIPWYEWHTHFLETSYDKNSFPVTHYYIQCYDSEPDVSQLICLYHGKNQHIYQGSEGEIRVHYLLGEEVSIYCEEKKDGYYIFINPVLKQEAYMYFVAMMLEKVLLEGSALILHSAYIEYEEQAILFTGPSGIGKSTQADLWVKYKNAHVVNGDRSILQKRDEQWNACGFPICGSSKISENKNYPIRAIIYLSQNPTDTVQCLYGFQAFQKTLSEISVNYWNKKATEKALGLVENLCKEIPMYFLKCTPTLNAVDCLFEEIM